MPFHQYYHDIFLAEKKDWNKYFDVKLEENKYDLNYLLKSFEEEDKNIELLTYPKETMMKPSFP